jgi:cytoskeletal protein CcmA (bactofilin family)
MSRPPFPAAPQPPGGQPGQQPGQLGAARPAAPQRQSAERRTMVIGRGISVHGTIQDAERLVVEGIVEAKMIQANELAIAQGGMFRGEVEVEEAEIAGTIDGTLTCRTALIVRSTGRVLGTARCRRLQVEDGGQITGQIEMITEPRSDRPSAAEAPKPAEPTA